MRIPSREDVGELLGKPAEWYLRWLRGGLGQYLLEQAGRMAFAEVRNFVDQGHGSIASELALVFEALPDDDQERFRNATADLLQSLDFSKVGDAKIALSVVELGAAIGARGLLPILAAKSFSMQDKHGTALFDLAFELSAQLADLDPDKAVGCLKHLIGHEGLFQRAMVGRALVALTQAQPEEFPAHFQYLQCRGAMLDEQFGYALHDPDEEALRETARARLLRRLARRLPDKMLLGRAPDPPEWWIDLLAEQLPEAIHGVSPSPAPFTWADWQAECALRARDLWKETIQVMAEVLQTEGRRFAAVSNDYSRLLRTTGVDELFGAVSALGDTARRRPSHDMTQRELQDDVLGI